jgi:RNA polymerase sigma-70 factor (ECF subfamily)
VLTTTQPETRLLDTLEQGFAQLSPQQRSLVLLRDHDGFSNAEMATMTGLSMEQVKVCLFRARSAMKHALVDLGQVA